jgi:hypothetical protein
MRVSEPLETKIAAALDAAGIEYLTDYEGKSPANLDFYLPDYDLYLEIKGGHSDRISGQMARHHNVIAIQGVKSVAFVTYLLENT